MKSHRLRTVLQGARTPEGVALGVLALFTLTAVLGYGVFALHPNLIPDSQQARAVYAASFTLFARTHIILAGMVLLVPLVRLTGLSWVPAFVAIAGVSFLSEYVGTGYGFPFGGYEYTSLLGYKLGGRVPAVIPVSWFLMALPSWAMARKILPDSAGWIPRTILGAYLLTAWDLALDPAMSFLTPYWVWESSGPFYGMPWVNLAGWMGTGLVLMGLFELLRAGSWVSRLSTRWLVAYYAILLLMPVGMLLAAEVWGAVGVTAGALFLPWIGYRLRHTSILSSRPIVFSRKGVAS